MLYLRKNAGDVRYEPSNDRREQTLLKVRKIENQIKIGLNRSGTQRCRRKHCGIRYAQLPETCAYSEETKNLHFKFIILV